jgi:hypothetical protein
MNQTPKIKLIKLLINRRAVLHLTQDECLHPSAQCATLGTVNLIICHSLIRFYIQYLSYHIYSLLVNMVIHKK